MTTIIMATNMLSFKTGESELEIQQLQKSNLKEIDENKRSLNMLLKKHRDLKKCTLCLGPAEKNIFNNESDTAIVDEIKSILNIEIRRFGQPQYICGTCEDTVHKAAELKKVAEASQWIWEQETEMECNEDNKDANEDSKDVTFDINNQKEVNNQDNKEAVKEEPFVCETCGLELKTMWRLKIHSRVHKNTFDFACSECPYKTKTRYSLETHIRKHTGDKPYECEDCGAKFTSASNLASHKRSHLPPSLMCEFCDKGFKFKQPLLNHIRALHHPAKPFVCFCGVCFNSKKLLRRHELKAHNRPKMRVGATPSYIKSQEEIESEVPENLYH